MDSLTVKEVASKAKGAPGRFSDGNGLHLQTTYNKKGT